MKLIIFGGFLGSGKTSLILSFARHLAKERTTINEEKAVVALTGDHKGIKLVIIENEIGKEGIDNKVLKSFGFEVKELFSGCVCCQLATDLVSELNAIYEKISPEWVIIEATGLAYPGKILGTVCKYGKGLESVNAITVVDAERWDMLLKITPDLLKKQVEEADVLLINKIDLVEEDAISGIEKQLRETNPKALVFRTSCASIDDGVLWEKVVDIFGKQK